MAITKHAIFLVAVHGLHGTENDWKYFEDSLEHQFGKFCTSEKLDEDLLFCLVSKRNALLKTYEGLEVMGRRLCKEIHEYFVHKILPQLDNDPSCQWNIYFSCVGHSLGGLILRMAIRHLISTDSDFSLAYIHKSITIRGLSTHSSRISVVPASYVSISTPHLGSRRPKENDAWSVIVSHGAMTFCSLAGGKTGKELVLIDAKDQVDSSVLMEMSNHDGPYVKALLMFANRTIVGHIQDFTVPASSALIAPHHQPKRSETADMFSIVAAAGFTPNLKRKSFVGSKGDMAKDDSSVTEFDMSAEHLPSMFEEDDLYSRLVFEYRNPSASPLLRPAAAAQPLIAADLKQPYSVDWEKGLDVEYNPKMLNNLNKIKWRRILLDYNFNSIWRYTIHAVVIGKEMPLIPQSLKKLGQRSTDFLVKLCLVDYIHARRRSVDQKPKSEDVGEVDAEVKPTFSAPAPLVTISLSPAPQTTPFLKIAATNQNQD